MTCTASGARRYDMHVTACATVLPTAPVVVDPCSPSPCGANADCQQKNGLGICICHKEYFGNPYVSCQPECVLDGDCARNKNCVRNKCVNLCPGPCGSGADCSVVNHMTMCSCPEGYTGDPFSYCRPIPVTSKLLQSAPTYWIHQMCFTPFHFVLRVIFLKNFSILQIQIDVSSCKVHKYGR